MAYELKEYLNSINFNKNNLMDGEDDMYEKKYSPFIVNKCLAPHNDCVLLKFIELRYNHYVVQDIY